MSTVSLPESLSQWRQPPASLRPQPFMVWNGEVTERRITEMLEQFAARGCGGVFIHPRPGLVTEYLSDEWFRLWGFALAEAKRLGIECHIYDENSYPTGFAGGHVVSANPLASSSMLMGRLVPSGTDALARRARVLATVRRADTAGAELCPREEQAPAAQAGALMSLELENPRPSLWSAGFTYVDLCRPEVTDQFLEFTHAAYARHFAADFGKTIRYAFADEPEIGYGGNGLTLSRFVLHAFRVEHGYDLLDKLVPLCFEHPESGAVRHDYFLTLNRLFVENYARRCHDWCERHGLEFTGHFMEHQWPTPKGSPSSMAVQRWMQAPGLDLLGFQFYPTDLRKNALWFFNVKEVASVAAQCDRARVLCESCGGGGYEFTPADMKPLEDFLLAGGVNLLNPHLAHQTLSGARKYDWPHTLTDHAPWWDAYRAQADHAGRVNAALSAGAERNRVLVLVPTTTGWIHHRTPSFFWPGEAPEKVHERLRAGFTTFLADLASAQIDFDLGDEFLLAELGRAEGGRLVVGARAYDAVVLPEGFENLLPSTLALLEKHLAAGGRLDALAPAPALVSGRADSRPAALAARFPDAWRRHADAPALLAALRARVTPRLRAPDGAALAGDPVWRRVELRDGSGVVYFIANCWDRPFSADVLLEGARVVALDTRRGVEETPPSRPHAEGQVVSLTLPPRGHALWFVPAPALAAKLPPATAPGAAPAAGADWRAVAVHALGAPVALEPNLLFLDYCDYEGPGGVTLRDVNSIHADNAHWHAQGFDQNLWRSSIQFRRAFLDAPRVSPSGFTVRFRFHVETGFAATPAARALHLGVERSWLYEIRLNGRTLPQADAARWFDEHMRLVACGDAVRAGENIVELVAAKFDPLHEIMPIYVRGDFSLTARERGFSVAPATPLTASDWTRQGRPFYSGKVAHEHRLDLAAPARQLSVACPDFAGSAIDVWLDDRLMGHLLHPHDRLVVDGNLSAGAHTLRLLVAGNLKNQLGPHFNDGLPGAWSWELSPEHLPAGASYRFYPTGLLGLPRVEAR